MASIFPASASVGQVFNSYTFDGTSWNIEGFDFNLDYLEESTASATYLTKASASSIYVTQNSALNTYATKQELEDIDLSSASGTIVAAIVDTAPSTLDTLNELSAALNDDANFASTVATSLGNKLDASSASITYATKTNPEFLVVEESLIYSSIGMGSGSSGFVSASGYATGNIIFNSSGVFQGESQVLNTPGEVFFVENGDGIDQIRFTILSSSMITIEGASVWRTTVTANISHLSALQSWASGYNVETNGIMWFDSITGLYKEESSNITGSDLLNTQPLDDDLTQISNLSGLGGLLRMDAGSGGNSWSFDTTTYASVVPPTQTGFRNIIINGDFRINQRNYIKNTNLASGSYGFDRWKSTFTNTSLDFVGAPNGQMVTISSGGSIEQIIERENIAAGEYVLTWTGTATGRVYKSGTTPPSYSQSPIAFSFDGLTNVEVEFTASGGTRTLNNVQLERALVVGFFGDYVGTPFEKRPIGTELALCQRYYWLGGNGSPGIFNTGTTARYSVIFPVTMRVAPVISATAAPYAINPTVSEGQTGSQTTGFAQTSGAGGIQTNSASQIQFGGFSSGADGRPTTLLNNCLEFNAEL